MKHVMIALLILSSTMVVAQAPGFGIKGGLNYGSVGDLKFTSEFANDTFSKENRTGFHAGIFYKIELVGLFVQPEVLYTKLNTEYAGTNNFTDGDLTYEFSKIDIPLLAGFNVIGPLNVKVGPSFQYILNSGLKDVDIDFQDPENSFTVGYQLGVGVTLGQLGVDVRYEGAFQDNTIVSDLDILDSSFRVDSRPSQWILSVSYSLDTK